MPLRTRFLIGSLCALLAACQPGLQTPPPVDYTSGIELASRQIERLKYADANTLLSTLTSTHPQQPDAWRLLGGTLYLQQLPTKAHAVFNQGLAVVPPATRGYKDLALQSALLCVNHPQLECNPELQIAQIPTEDPRRQIIAAARDAQAGNDVKALKRIISLLKQPLPKTVASDIYIIAALIYKRMNEPMYVNESLFHAMNFAKSPIIVQRIEQLWKPQP